MNILIRNSVVGFMAITLPIFAGLSDDIKSSVVKSKSSFLKSAYSSSLYDPIWINNNGLTTLGNELIEHIKKDKTVAEDLPFYKLYRSVKQDLKKGRYSANLDIKMTKLYKAYMDYLIKGGIDWNAFDRYLEYLKKKYDYNVGWEHYAPPYSSKRILERAKLNDTFGDAFNSVEPTRFKYKKLKKALAHYIDIKHNGGWKIAKVGTTLKPGMENPAIPIIRKRLKVVGDLKGCSQSMDSTIYDNCMAKAVRRFKLRHGFKGNSVIDKGTRAELRKGVNYYIKKMRLNLDRIKWSYRKEARVRIELNIPAFRLYVYDGKDLVTTMRVITGKPNHPTPIFHDVMTTVVVNPYWRIPESIVKKEMIKHLIKNPHYYDKQHKFLYDGWGPNANRVNPAKVKWSKYKADDKHIPYHFMQSPSSRNALGKIKFLFPNKYSVYIHDTPSKRLFFRDIRAFSHGCMRIQKPRELLKALSLYNSNIKVDSIMRKLGTNDNTQIPLRRRIPVDITYFTSFIDDYGNLHFRRDIYGYDKAQYKNYYKGSVISSKVPKKQSSKKDLKPTKKLDKKEDKVKKHTKTKVKQEHKVKKSPVKKTTPKRKVVHKKPQANKPDYEIIEIGY